MSGRLFVFGCSNTYGEGLPDCWPSTSKPSKLGWAGIIAKTLNKKLINKSLPGASNKFIWYKIINTRFKPNDLVIILWSYTDRYSIIQTPWSITPVNHSIDNIKNKMYYEHIHSFYDADIMSKLFIDHTSNHLTNLGVGFYQTICNRAYRKLFKDTKHMNIYFDDYWSKWPKALDNHHLGIEGNVAFAKDILDFMGCSHNLETPKKINILARIKNFIFIRLNIQF